MSDRFDFLEIGDKIPEQLPLDGSLPISQWKPTTLRPVEVIGSEGTGVGQFKCPTALITDGDGALYVVDSGNHRVQRIALNGDVMVIGSQGSGRGQMMGPSGVAVHPTTRAIFVADQGNHRVLCFGANSAPLKQYSGFSGPSGIVVDSEGKLWVADTGNSRLLRIDTVTGNCIGGIDRSMGMLRPVSVACDNAKNLYITDAQTADLCRYTYFGKRAHALGEIRRLQAPSQSAVSSEGIIYLAETGADRLHVFGSDGNSLLTLDTPMRKLGPLNKPSGVAIGPLGEIYVSDTLNHRVIRFAWD